MSRRTSTAIDGKHPLDYLYIDLQENLQLDLFVNAYRTTCALQYDDIEKLTSKHNTRDEKLTYLVAIAKERDPDLSGFVKALQTSIDRLNCKQHEHLLDLVKKTLEKTRENEMPDNDLQLTRSLSRLSIDVASDFTKLCCVGCQQMIESSESMMSLHSETNPHGYRHKFYQLSGIGPKAGFEYSGNWTAEYSWFEGYSWRIVNCGRCKRHWGWHFNKNTDTKENTGRQSFFGIRKDALCLLP